MGTTRTEPASVAAETHDDPDHIEPLYEEGTHVAGPHGTFVGTLTKNLKPNLVRVETDDMPGGVVFIHPARLRARSNAGRR